MRTDSVNDRRVGAARDRRARADRLRRRGTRSAEPRRYKTKQRGRTGGARGDPADVRDAHARPDGGRRSTRDQHRAVPADLAAHGRLADGRGAIQAAVRRHRGHRRRGRPTCLRSTGQQLLFDGFRRVYFEGRDDAPDEDAEAMLPALDGRASPAAARGPARAALHAATAAIHRGLAREDAGGARHRPAVHLRVDRSRRSATASTSGSRSDGSSPRTSARSSPTCWWSTSPTSSTSSFTAKMEDELDEIAEGKLGWAQVLDEFYGPFERLLEKNEDEITAVRGVSSTRSARGVPTEGREPGHLIVKLGRYGKFIGCDEYPECRYIRNLDGTERPEPELLDETVPRVRPPARPQGRPIRARSSDALATPSAATSRRRRSRAPASRVRSASKGRSFPSAPRGGRSFYSCDRYPDCTFAAGNAPVPDRPCPECGSVMLEQPERRRAMLELRRGRRRALATS